MIDGLSAEMGVPAAQPPTPKVDDRPLQIASMRRVFLPIAAWTLALYLLTFLAVRRHYVIFLPHYDSIGSFSYLYDIVNNVQAGHLTDVIAAGVSIGTTWLQPAYALLLAWAPIKAPEWLVSLNFVLLLAAQAAIIDFERTIGASPLRQGIAALLPVVPGSMYAWDGGIQDLRRDIQLVILALAILFLAMSYVLQPSWRRGAALGLLVGLAQWSRDNAAAVIVIVTLPALALAVSRSRSAGGSRLFVRLAMVPVGVFLLVAVPYYGFSLPATIERYAVSVWGVGESRIESLMAFWNMPLSTLLGGDFRISGRVRVAAATGALLSGAVLALGLLCRRGVLTVRLDRLRQPGPALLLASGAWVVAAVLLYNTLLLGYGARWHGVPFLPIMVGLVALMVGLLGAVSRDAAARQDGGRGAALAVGAASVVLLLSAPLRMVLNEQVPVGAEDVAAVRAASIEIAQLAAGRPVAFLSYDRFSRHHAQYYLAQAGIPPMADFERTAKAYGDFIDLDQPMRATDTPDELRQRLDRTVRTYADFALVLADPARYDDPREPLWPYQLGRPVVEGLLSDPSWQRVAAYEMAERSFVVLKNNGPSRVSAGPGQRQAAADTAPVHGLGLAGHGGSR